MDIFGLIGDILIIAGLLFVILGVAGILRFNDFYSRILIASKIDTVGLLTLTAGIVLKKGLSFFSLKLALIVIIMLIINPVITNSIVRSAYYSDYRGEREKDQCQ